MDRGGPGLAGPLTTLLPSPHSQGARGNDGQPGPAGPPVSALHRLGLAYLSPGERAGAFHGPTAVLGLGGGGWREDGEEDGEEGEGEECFLPITLLR